MTLPPPAKINGIRAVSVPGQHSAQVFNAQILQAGVVSSVSLTRPSNTTAYTAGDVIGIADAETPANAGSAIFEFTSVGNTGELIKIAASTFQVNLSAVPASMTSFKLHLYNASPTAILDNAAFDLVSGDRTKYLGSIDLGTPADLGSTLFSQNDAVNKLVKLVTTSFYGVIETASGYTPASGTGMTVTLITG